MFSIVQSKLPSICLVISKNGHKLCNSFYTKSLSRSKLKIKGFLETTFQYILSGSKSDEICNTFHFFNSFKLKNFTF